MKRLERLPWRGFMPFAVTPWHRRGDFDTARTRRTVHMCELCMRVASLLAEKKMPTSMKVRVEKLSQGVVPWAGASPL